MGFFYQRGYGVPPYRNFSNQNTNPFVNVSAIDNGAVWFVATAPFFSLFLESVSSNKIAAVILWIFTYALSVAVCVYDKKKILSRLYNTKSLEHTHFIPILYLFKRNSVTKHNGLYSVVCVISVLFALTQNGFSRFYLTGEKHYISTVKEYSASQIVDFEEYDTITDKTIEKAFEDYLRHDEIIWKCEKGNKISTVTASAETNYSGAVSTLEITFLVNYDGFSFDGIEIADLKIDGKAIANDERSILLMQIFSENETDSSTKKYTEA